MRTSPAKLFSNIVANMVSLKPVDHKDMSAGQLIKFVLSIDVDCGCHSPFSTYLQLLDFPSVCDSWLRRAASAVPAQPRRTGSPKAD